MHLSPVSDTYLLRVRIIGWQSSVDPLTSEMLASFDSSSCQSLPAAKIEGKTREVWLLPHGFIS